MKCVVTIEIDDKELNKLNGVITGETKNLVCIDNDSDYVRWFNETCYGWSKSSEFNQMFLKQQQQYANELLRANGRLYLNDVYKMLGIPTTNAGQVVGWIYDENNPIGDNFVDFGLYDDCNADFINGHTLNALLNFNVDGCILNR